MADLVIHNAKMNPVTTQLPVRLAEPARLSSSAHEQAVRHDRSTEEDQIAAHVVTVPVLLTPLVNPLRPVSATSARRRSPTAGGTAKV